MKIHVVASVGTGLTTLSAFDSALNNSGIANYNLLRLSSVIPPNSQVVVKDRVETLPGSWGDRLYVVMAEQRAEKVGEQAWAGIGWVIEPSSGKGLFVEHEGESEAHVKEQIRLSLTQLMSTRNVDFGDIKMHVIGAKVENKPVCALVIAAYQVSDWNNKPFQIEGSK